MPKFTHLHVHTHHSLLDGVASPTAILDRAKELGFEAVAITDHGSMGAHLEAQLEADHIGNIKVIFGIEAYIVDDYLLHSKEQRGANHIVLLVKNEQGYKNLIKLNNIAWQDGFYYTPRIDLNLLAKYHKGLICLTSCAKGVISGPIMGADFKQAREKAQRLKKIFDEDLYFELQPIGLFLEHDPGTNLQDLINKYLITLADEYKIKVVLTNDVHFLNKGDDVLQTRLVKILREDFTYAAQDNWLKTVDELWEAWKFYCPDISGEWFLYGLKNAAKIAEQCNYKIPAEGSFNIPKFDHTKHPHFRNGLENKEEFFADLLSVRLRELGLINEPEYVERLLNEFKIIEKLKVIDYFLIVEDLFRYARANGVLCHTRGSVNGSLIAYLLDYGVVDPIQHNILFERFLSPSRLLTGRSDIDIDCDFEAEWRDQAIAYLKEKYGQDRVCQVGSYNRMQLKAGIKDMGRIEYDEAGDEEFSFQQLNRITRLMLTNDIDRELESDDFKRWYNKHKDWLKTYVVPIIGNPRAFAGHPAGVAITPSAIDEWLPIRTQLDKKSKMVDGKAVRIPATAWENSHTGREDLFARGIMCLDCLGVKTLSVISKCIKDINACYSGVFAFEDIPLDDPKTIEAFKKGETLGVFQLSAPKITAIIREMKPDRFEDIAALGALDRPGPLTSKAHVRYINRKHGEEEIDYMHKSLKPVLSDTYGVPVFSEHMMLMVTEFAGMSMLDAEKMRQVVKAKDVNEFRDFKTKFIKSAQEKWGKDIRQTAERIWDAIRAFGTYAFPKAHATAYAYYGNATQYIKVHHPTIFFKNFMNYADHSEYAEIKRVSEKEYGVKYCLPSINLSKIGFHINPVLNEKMIIWALSAIKGLGDKAAQEIVDRQPFNDFDDFFKRVNRRKVHKNIFEVLITVRAFHEFGDRKHLMEEYYRLRKEKWDGRIKWAQYTEEDWDIAASELLGFDLIDMKDVFATALKNYNLVDYNGFVNALEGQAVAVAGKIIKTHKHAFTQNGVSKDMMFVDIDVDGREIPAVIWSDLLAELKSNKNLPHKGSCAVIGGMKSIRKGRSQISMDVDCWTLEILH